MHRLIRLLILTAALVPAASLVAGSAAAVTSSPSLAGTWSGTYSGAFAGTFKLHWKQFGSKLTGRVTLSNPSGNYSMTGSVHGDAIKFGAVGAGATYTGSVSGKSMSGHYKTLRGGGTWSAHKTS